MLMKAKRGFLHSIGYLNCTKNHIRLDLLLTLAHVRLPNYQTCYPLVLLLPKNKLLNIVKKSMKGPVRICFGQSKNSCEVLNKLKSRGFRASSLSTLYTTLPHNLIKDKLVDLIERTFQREGSLYIACNDKNAFFTFDAVRNYNLWSCQKVCEALTFFLDNIYIIFGSKLYRQIVGIPMGTNCAPLIADLFLFCYERDFVLSLPEDNQSDVIEAFNSTSRYLDYLLNIDNNFFDSMVNPIYPSELQAKIRPTCQIPRPHFWIYIYQYRMVLSRLKFMINETILILIL